MAFKGGPTSGLIQTRLQIHIHIDPSSLFLSFQVDMFLLVSVCCERLKTKVKFLICEHNLDQYD